MVPDRAKKVGRGSLREWAMPGSISTQRGWTSSGRAGSPGALAGKSQSIVKTLSGRLTRSHGEPGEGVSARVAQQS